MIVYLNKNTLEVVSQARFSQLVDSMFYNATQKHSKVYRTELEDVWIRTEVQEAECASVSDSK